MSPNEKRQELFRRIKNARNFEEVQEIALVMWHDLNATQEGFICPGCANCEFVEDRGGARHPPQP